MKKTKYQLLIEVLCDEQHLKDVIIKQIEAYGLKPKLIDVDFVLDRLTAWRDSHKMIETEASANTVKNYTKLIDKLTGEG